MAIESKYKKRGSNLSLIVMLVLLLGIVAAIIFWPTEAETTEDVVVEETVAEQPAKSEEKSEEQKELDEVETTTLIQVGDEAPDFTVNMLDGRTIKLSELRGKVVMVCFWATWCPPCRQELAHLQEGVIDQFAGKEFVVLPISRGEGRDVVEKFITDNGYKFAVGLDPDQSIYRLYATNFIPRTFIVGKDGKVVYRVAGYDEKSAEEVNAAIAKAL